MQLSVAENREIRVKLHIFHFKPMTTRELAVEDILLRAQNRVLYRTTMSAIPRGCIVTEQFLHKFHFGNRNVVLELSGNTPIEECFQYDFSFNLDFGCGSDHHAGNNNGHWVALSPVPSHLWFPAGLEHEVRTHSPRTPLRNQTHTPTHLHPPSPPAHPRRTLPVCARGRALHICAHGGRCGDRWLRTEASTFASATPCRR